MPLSAGLEENVKNYSKAQTLIASFNWLNSRQLTPIFKKKSVWKLKKKKNSIVIVKIKSLTHHVQDWTQQHYFTERIWHHTLGCSFKTTPKILIKHKFRVWCQCQESMLLWHVFTQTVEWVNLCFALYLNGGAAGAWSLNCFIKYQRCPLLFLEMYLLFTMIFLCILMSQQRQLCKMYKVAEKGNTNINRDTCMQHLSVYFTTAKQLVSVQWRQ